MQCIEISTKSTRKRFRFWCRRCCNVSARDTNIRARHSWMNQLQGRARQLAFADRPGSTFCLCFASPGIDAKDPDRECNIRAVQEIAQLAEVEEGLGFRILYLALPLVPECLGRCRAKLNKRLIRAGTQAVLRAVSSAVAGNTRTTREKYCKHTKRQPRILPVCLLCFSTVFPSDVPAFCHRNPPDAGNACSREKI